jgi:signal peptidase I
MLLLIGIVGIIVLFTNKVAFIGINTNKSLDGSVYIVNRLKKHFKKGDLVVFYFKGSKYYPPKYRMIKLIRCLPRDTLSAKGRNFYCNNRFIGEAKQRDKQGKDTPLFVWDGMIPEGRYFVMGTHIDSYDSRYWGFVEQKDIIGKAYLLIGGIHVSQNL